MLCFAIAVAKVRWFLTAFFYGNAKICDIAHYFGFFRKIYFVLEFTLFYNPFYEIILRNRVLIFTK